MVVVCSVEEEKRNGGKKEGKKEREKERKERKKEGEMKRWREKKIGFGSEMYRAR